MGRPKKDGTPAKHPAPRISKRKFLAALPGTGGVKKLIAERLDCNPNTVALALKRPSWADVLEAYNEECERVKDLAEETIIHAMTQKTDLPEASKNARWYLTRKAKERGYADESKVTVQGGDRPLRVQSAIVSLEMLVLPLAVRKQILKAIEVREAQLLEAPGEGPEDDDNTG